VGVSSKPSGVEGARQLYENTHYPLPCSRGCDLHAGVGATEGDSARIRLHWTGVGRFKGDGRCHFAFTTVSQEPRLPRASIHSGLFCDRTPCHFWRYRAGPAGNHLLYPHERAMAHCQGCDSRPRAGAAFQPGAHASAIQHATNRRTGQFSCPTGAEHGAVS
jgi:hypothetical protein